MAKKDKGLLHRTFTEARDCIKANDPDRARDLFDFMIFTVANERWENDVQVDDKIEGVKVGVWLERAWYGLENNNLLL